MLDKYTKNKVFLYIYSAFLFVYALYFIVNGWDSYRLNVGDTTNTGIVMVNDTLYLGLQGLVLIASALLILSSRLTNAMLPVLVLTVLATACYDSSSKFLSLDFLWVAPIAVFALVFHFIYYRKPFRVGRSFYGVCAVAVSITLGGIGFISASDYFSGTSLFYMFGLGIGMVLFYLLIKSQMGEEEKTGIARVMYLVGLLAAFSILWLYVTEWELFKESGGLLKPQFSNNLSTIIMMAMPFTIFYPSRKWHFLDFPAFFFMYAMVAVSGSRGGLFFGAIEVVLLLIVYCFCYRKGRKSILPRILLILFAISLCAVLWFFLPQLTVTFHFLEDTNGISRLEILKKIYESFFGEGESRVGFLDRMVRDFKSNPLFGTGIGNTSNTDLYSPVKGAMVWYHMWLPQIVGSLGLLGIAAYGYQLFARVRIYLCNLSDTNRAFFYSYIGLLLMSQVNPGEFCPVPYAMLAVTCFAMIEPKEQDVSLKESFERLFKRKRTESEKASIES